MFTTSQLDERSGAAVGSQTGVRRAGKGKVHVCLSSDDPDLRPAAVAIRSAAASAADPSRLVFHFITAPDYADLFRDLFHTYLPDLHVLVHHNETLQERIESFVGVRGKAKQNARDDLATPFNLAPFYLPEFLLSSGGGKAPQRLIYLDTDTVVLGDLAELHDLALKGHPCAAVRHCTQRLEDYVDFAALRDLGFHAYDPKACIASRGVMVVDTVRWRAENVTSKIEDWLVRYRTAKRLLWVGGVSQPPWLLALNGNFLDLKEDWSCSGLGRDSMSAPEAAALKQAGLDRLGLARLGARVSRSGQIAPAVVPCSRTAKLLHFSGFRKPWLEGEEDDELEPSATCALPRTLSASRWGVMAMVELLCKGVAFVNCSELWSSYITPEAACALKDFDKEWRDDEATWLARRKEKERGHEMERLEETRRKQAAERVEREFQAMQLRESAQREKERQGQSQDQQPPVAQDPGARAQTPADGAAAPEGSGA